jgi:hypothetical protein
MRLVSAQACQRTLVDDHRFPLVLCTASEILS